MKKISILLLTLFVIACSEKSSMIGKWHLVDGSYSCYNTEMDTTKNELHLQMQAVLLDTTAENKSIETFEFYKNNQYDQIDTQNS